MQAVNIRTTQNVQLEYPLAGVGERLLAYAIDMIIVGSFYFIVSFIYAVGGDEPSLAVLLIIAVIAFSYRLIMEISFNGQTVGKMALNIRVVKLDGSTPSVIDYLIRWLLELIEFLILGLAVLMIILTKNGQRLGDLLAGTTVIKIKKVSRVMMENKVILEKVADDYSPTFLNAGDITDHEIRLIKASLKAYRDDALAEPMETLAKKLQEKYDFKSDLPTVKFLYTLLRDHSYFVSQ
jgi:uncharacterized RDD family membrane protein YckC